MEHVLVKFSSFIHQFGPKRIICDWYLNQHFIICFLYTMTIHYNYRKVSEYRVKTCNQNFHGRYAIGNHRLFKKYLFHSVLEFFSMLHISLEQDVTIKYKLSEKKETVQY